MAWREGSPKIKEFEKCLINQFLSLLKKPPGKIKQSFQVSKKVAHTTSNWLPPHPRKLPRPHQLREHIPFPKLTILRDKRPPHPQLILRSATSGTFRDFWKNDQRIKIGRRTIKIGFYFFTYECCRRRVPLIKTIHGVEEVLILLFTAFRYEYLF